MSLSADSRISAEAGATRPIPVPIASIWIGYLVFLLELIAVVMTSIAAGGAYQHFVHAEPVDPLNYVGIGLAAFLYYGIFFAYRGNYSFANLASQSRQFREVTIVWVAVCLIVLGLTFLLKIGLSRGATLSFFFFAWLFLVTWRWCLARMLSAAREKGTFAYQNVIVVCDVLDLDRSARLSELRRTGYHVAKIVAVDAERLDNLNAVIAAARETPSIDCIFLMLGWENGGLIRHVMRVLSVIPLPVRLLPNGAVAGLLEKPMFQVGTVWAAELQRGPLAVHERCIKQFLDLVIAATMAVALAPLFVLVAILIKLESAGPVFFVQTREGFNDRPFRIFKFRTLHTLEDGPVVRQVCRDDPRLTRIGRFLRKFNIDELPQLLNVLRGEMSMVGPRPHASAHNSEYAQVIAKYAFRHHVKPGLTGWAQVSGFRGETDVELMQKRVDYDLWYIDNWSLWLDIKIIVKTAALILFRPSSY